MTWVVYGGTSHMCVSVMKIKENMKLNSYWTNGKDEAPNSIYVLKWTLKWTINPSHYSIRMDAMHGEMKDSRSTRIVRCVVGFKFEFNSNSRWWMVVMQIRVQGGCRWEFEINISSSPHIQLEFVTMDGEIRVIRVHFKCFYIFIL